MKNKHDPDEDKWEKNADYQHSKLNIRVLKDIAAKKLII